MQFYSVWPAFLEMALLFALVRTPLFRAADVLPTSATVRVNTIDGLRGFLALGVFFFHAVMYHRYLTMGLWELPPSHFYSMIGPTGVTMFFMITGYLFWNKVLCEQGRPDWKKLYVGRAFRILPLYWIMVVLVFATVGAYTGFHLQVSTFRILKQLARWSLGGLRSYGLINNYPHTLVTYAGVVWTLQFEWFFYASLFLTSFLARNRKSGFYFPLLALVAASVYAFREKPGLTASASVCVCMFLVGMVTASIRRLWPKTALSNTAASVTVLLLFLFFFLVFKDATTISAVLILGVAFYFVASETTVFGLLITKASKRLGDISYGIYLLQGPVLSVTYLSSRIRALAIGSPMGTWLIILFAGITLVSLSTITHALIERPGVDLAGDF